VRHPRRISAHAKWLFFHPDITMQKSWIPLKNSGAGDIERRAARQRAQAGTILRLAMGSTGELGL
jgi:hypothetical protein